MHLTIPTDVQEQELDENEVEFFNPDEYRASESILAPQAQIDQVIDLLRQAQRPFVIAGEAAGYTQDGRALMDFAETARVPILTEGQARGLVPDDHPYGFGFFERGLNRAATMLRNADLVLLLGRKQDYTIGFCRPPNVAADAKIVQIDPSPAEIGRNRGVAVGIVGDVASVVQQLTEAASRHTWQDLPWLEELRASRAAQAEWAEGLAVSDVTPMHAMFVHKTLESMLRPDDFLSFDGGDFCHFGRALLPAQMPKKWSYVSSLGMLGSSLPSALAAQVAYPESRVINVTGDGAFGFNGMEFDTAVRHGLNVVTVLGNDAAWGIDRQIQLGPLRASGSHRPAPDPLRPGSAGTWAATASLWSGRRNLKPALGTGLRRQQAGPGKRSGAAGHQPPGRGGHSPAPGGNGEVGTMHCLRGCLRQPPILPAKYFPQ